MASTRRHLLCRLGNLLIITRSYAKGNSVEMTILRYSETCDKNSTSWSSQSATIYEVVAALTSGCDDVMLWDEFDVERKADLGFPSIDVGIDYLSENGQLAGQAKNYVKTLYVKTDHMVRTQLCAYTATLGGMPLRKIEFTTRKDTRMGHPLVRPEDFTQRIVDEDQLRECFSEAIALMPEIQKEQLLAQTILPPLRECQISALKALSESTSKIRRRVRMAPGTGKSRIAIEYMKSKGGKWLILVPSIVLVEQWTDLLEMVGITTVVIDNYRAHGPVALNKLVVVISTFASANKVGLVEDNTVTPQEHFDSDDDEETLLTTGSEEDEEKILSEEQFGEDDYESDESNMDDESTRLIVDFDSFDGVIIDEAHHIEEHGGSVHGPIWRGIRRMEKNKGGNSVVCFSASLDKESGEDLTYEYGLREAIDQEVLVDYSIIVPIWLGEPSLEDIAKFLVEDKRFVSILAYCNTVESCKKFVECLRALGETAEWISGEEPRVNRHEKLDRFRGRGHRVLVSVQLLSEGINLVSADTCVLVEPRKSSVSIVQCAGRVLRLDEGKKRSWIVVPSGVIDGEESARRPVVRILQVLGGEDSRLVRGKGGKKSGRIAYEVGVKEVDEETEENNELLRVDIYDNDTYTLLHDSRIDARAIRLVEWWTTYGRPRSGGENVTAEERELYLIYSYLRRYKAKRESSLQVKRYISHHIPGWDTVVTFEDRLRPVLDFYAIEKRLPMRDEICPRSGVRVGDFLSTLKYNYKKGTLSKERILYLSEKLPGWSSVYTFQVRIQPLVDFYTLTQRLPTKDEVCPQTGIRIGGMLATLRNTRKNGKILSENLQYINDNIPGWVKMVDPWEKYQKLLEYIRLNNGNLPKSRSDAGTILSHIRNRYNHNKLPLEDQEYLTKQLGDQWKPTSRKKVDIAAATASMKTRYAKLFDYKGDRPLKANGDSYSGNLLGYLRNEYVRNALWVTDENVVILDTCIPFWRSRSTRK